MKLLGNSKASLTIAVATFLDLLGGLAFATVEHLPVGSGLYWAVTTATTVGYGDVIPHTTAGHIVAVLVMFTVIPLFASAFSLVTSGLAAVHIHAEGQQMRQRLDHVIHHHPDIPAFKDN